jgi:hypothetical protein
MGRGRGSEAQQRTQLFTAPLQDLRKLGPFNGQQHQICSTNRTGLRAYLVMLKEMKEKTKQLRTFLERTKTPTSESEPQNNIKRA